MSISMLPPIPCSSGSRSSSSCKTCSRTTVTGPSSLQRPMQDTDPGHRDTQYKSYNRFSSSSIVMPFDHKMIPHSTLWHIRDDIKGLLLDYETHAAVQFLRHDGVGLVWPTICGCKDLLPHIEDHLTHRQPGQ